MFDPRIGPKKPAQETGPRNPPMEPAGHRAGTDGKAAAGRARFRVVQRPFQGAKLRPDAGPAAASLYMLTRPRRLARIRRRTGRSGSAKNGRAAASGGAR